MLSTRKARSSKICRQHSTEGRADWCGLFYSGKADPAPVVVRRWCARPATQKGRCFHRPFAVSSGFPGLLAVAEKAEQEHEHVDEVEVQSQRAHDRRLAKPFLVALLGVRDVFGLDRLGVIGCQTRKISTPMAEMAKASADEARNRFTIIATNRPIRPIIRKVPIAERSRLVV